MQLLTGGSQVSRQGEAPPIPHTPSQTEYFVSGVEDLAPPVILQHTSQPFHRMVFAVVWRAVDKLKSMLSGLVFTLFANQKLFTDDFELFTAGLVHMLENYNFTTDWLSTRMVPTIDPQTAVIFGSAG